MKILSDNQEQTIMRYVWVYPNNYDHVSRFFMSYWAQVPMFVKPISFQ